jgi:hypothetical protein
VRKLARISRESVKTLIKVVGFEKTAKAMGETKSALTQRANGFLRWDDAYEYRVLKALKRLGVFQEVSLITKRAKRELKSYEEKFEGQD